MDDTAPVPMFRQDMNDMLSLVGKLVELPPDPILRRRCMLAGMCKLVKATMGFAYCGRFDEADDNHLRVAAFVHAGVSSKLQPLLQDYLKTGLPADPKRHVLVAETKTISTWRRSEMVDDPAWYDSAHFKEVRQPLGVDDCICTVRRLDDGGAYFCIAEVCRAPGQPPFTEADKWMVHSVRQVGCRLHRLCGTSKTPSSLQELPQRLQSVLPLLLAGDSEKDIAEKLKLSAHTVHGYTKSIYKKLGVTSRVELMSKWSAAQNSANSNPR